MRLKSGLLIFLLVFLSACATFKPLPSEHVSLSGVFSANYKGDTFDGFFSLADGNLRMDVVNSFGFSVYGIFVEKKKVFVKDFRTGKIYRDLRFNGLDLNGYKDTIVYLTENFTQLCTMENPWVVVLRCARVGQFEIPEDFILKAKNKRMRVILKNIKVVGKNK